MRKIIPFTLFIIALAALPLRSWGACTTTASSSCTAEQFAQGLTSVIMCFESCGLLKDNGSCSSDKSSLSCWDQDTLFTGPIEIDVLSLGDGASLASLGATAGKLTASASYPCAICNVSNIVLKSASSSCSVAASLFTAEGYPADFMSNMVMRGTDSCPGTATYPTTYPVTMGSEDTASFKFNVELSSNGAPRFIFKPLSGASIDTSNVATLNVSAKGASSSGTVYCGAFKSATPQGGAPDGGGGTGSISGSTASCTLTVPPGTFNGVGMFVDVDSNGADDGPGTNDLICLSSGFTVAAGETKAVDCGTLMTLGQLMGQ